MEYDLEIIAGAEYQKRSVAFLISKDRKVTAKENFDHLDKTGERTLRHRFDMWIDGQPGRHRYHTWDESAFKGEYTNCIVFKCGKQNQERFYGFIYPEGSDERSKFQVCVLVGHTKKKKDETDECDLKDVEEIRKNLAIQELIKKIFKEKL